MGLRDYIVELTKVEEFDEFLNSHDTVAVFKAGGCHKTMQGFGYVEDALEEIGGVPLAFVRVIENRPVSDYIAEVTGVVHQSPQFILIVNKKVVYDVDNWDITLAALQDALKQHVKTQENNQEKNQTAAERHSPKGIHAYLELIRSFLSGKMIEDDFKYQWLTMFRTDAELRPSKEFNLLNSLFGDVDRAIENIFGTGFSESTDLEGDMNLSKDLLKSKAQVLLKELETIS